MTPEGKIKARVKNLLADNERWGYIYTHWPVPSGYGEQTLDCIGCYHSRFFAIETKAPGKKPTPRQEYTMENMRRAGVAVFVIDSDDLTELELWLLSVRSSTIS
jgi:hypothetical protein